MKGLSAAVQAAVTALADALKADNGGEEAVQAAIAQLHGLVGESCSSAVHAASHDSSLTRLLGRRERERLRRGRGGGGGGPRRAGGEGVWRGRKRAPARPRSPGYSAGAHPGGGSIAARAAAAERGRPRAAGSSRSSRSRPSSRSTRSRGPPSSSSSRPSSWGQEQRGGRANCGVSGRHKKRRR